MNESSTRRGPLTFRCFDLETTGTDVETCEVVQAAVVSAPLDTDIAARGLLFSRAEAHSQLFAARDVPLESTRVHRITDRNPERFDFPVAIIPADAPPFGACVHSMARALTEGDTVAVSFNGCGYDIPVIARYLHRVAPGVYVSRDAAEARLRERHIDVMRLWARARAAALPMDDGIGARGLALTADLLIGGLMSAHVFWLGSKFDSAHDAANDCRATLAVLDAMLRSGFVDVEQAIRWSNAPLPGDVDFDGKFKWSGDQAVISFGKHAGTPLERLPASYLRWMLESDFPASTKDVVRRFLAGEYPARQYESES